MGRGESVKKGNIEMLLLHLMKAGDIYGYLLSKKIRELSDDVIQISDGSLYPALYRLIENGYVTDKKVQVGKRREVVLYHLEDKGEAYLNELVEGYLRTEEAIRRILAYTGEGEEK